MDPDPTVTVPTYLLTIFSENRQNNLILKPDRRPEIYAKQDNTSFNLFLKDCSRIKLLHMYIHIIHEEQLQPVIYTICTYIILHIWYTLVYVPARIKQWKTATQKLTPGRKKSFRIVVQCISPPNCIYLYLKFPNCFVITCVFLKFITIHS